MTVAHGTGARNAISAVVLAEIDSGTAGSIELQTATGNEVATLSLASPAGAVAGALLTFGAITPDNSATGGLSTQAVVKDSAGTVVLTLSAGRIGSGADIEFNLPGVPLSEGNNIPVGATVEITSLTYTAPV